MIIIIQNLCENPTLRYYKYIILLNKKNNIR